MPVLELEVGTIGLVDDKETAALRDPTMGALGCSKCNCGVYEDAGYGNSICTCRHTYEDHW